MPKRCRQTKARKRTFAALNRKRAVRKLLSLKLIKKDVAHSLLMGPLKGVMKWIKDKKYIEPKPEEGAEDAGK